ncbi:MAG: DUF1698 domain-containing protein [Wenzhouxiangellaceae bacterium]|nr:DUF1698 domain-containing protein [Wenzhouxiangellaceae bacterium]
MPDFFDQEISAMLEQRIAHRPRHRGEPRWQAALEALPSVEPGWHIENGVLAAGAEAEDRDALAAVLKTLIPWRKGPLKLGGVFIDTEWRSDRGTGSHRTSVSPAGACSTSAPATATSAGACSPPAPHA